MIENADNTEDKQEKAAPKKGAPRKEIDVEILKKLCEVQCTVKEMAYISVSYTHLTLPTIYSV